MQSPSRRGTFLPVVLGLVLIAALAALGVPSLRGGRQMTATPAQVADLLTRVGLGAPELAAAGCSAAQTETAIGAARDHIEAEYQAISAAEQAFAQRQRELDALTDTVRRGLASEAQVSGLAAALTARNQAASDRQAALDAVFAAGTDELPAERAAVLTTLRSHAARGLPVQYLAEPRTDAEWLRLREALAIARIASDRGESPDPAESSFLGTVQAATPTATAITNLQANLAAVQSAWNEAVNGA